MTDLPAHNHPVADTGHTHGPGSYKPAIPYDTSSLVLGGTAYIVGNVQNGTDSATLVTGTSGTGNAAFAGGNTGNSAASTTQPSVIPPVLAVNFIVKT